MHIMLLSRSFHNEHVAIPKKVSQFISVVYIPSQVELPRRAESYRSNCRVFAEFLFIITVPS